MNNSWTSHKQSVNKFCMNKLWARHKEVIKKSLTSLDQGWTSCETWEKAELDAKPTKGKEEDLDDNESEVDPGDLNVRWAM